LRWDGAGVDAGVTGSSADYLIARHPECSAGLEAEDGAESSKPKMKWFRCEACEVRQDEIKHLRAELVQMRRAIESISISGMDRIMARNYQDFAVGEAARSEPSKPITRSDEDEWEIEQAQNFARETIAQRNMKAVNDLIQREGLEDNGTNNS